MTRIVGEGDIERIKLCKKKKTVREDSLYLSENEFVDRILDAY